MRGMVNLKRARHGRGIDARLKESTAPFKATPRWANKMARGHFVGICIAGTGDAYARSAVALDRISQPCRSLRNLLSYTAAICAMLYNNSMSMKRHGSKS